MLPDNRNYMLLFFFLLPYVAFKCPTGKVYDACGPMHTSTCEHSVLPTVANDLTEGCFCPAGTKLFNSYSDICVATCSCVGPDGMPKNVSEKWISNCQECVCEATSLSVQCKPMTCAKPAPITCDKEGSIIVERPNPDQPCCTINECSCNSSNCLNKIHSCPLGFEVDPVLADGDCCPTYDCRPTVTCVAHDTIYQPGHKIPPTKDSCEDCFCTHEKDPETLLNLVKCDPIPCTKVCEKGYTYKEKAGQCCGDCVQVACVMQMDVDQNTVVIQPGETWYSSVDKCSYFECNKSNEHFVIMSVSKECTVASESDCAQGYVYKKDGDQCCGTCVQEACIMKLKDNSIKVLKPGDVWNPPNEVCNYYECHIIKDVPNDQYVPVEVRRKCDVVKCETGYEYKIKSGECCGGCIKVACTMTMNDNITITLQPGEEYIPQDEKCISYTCSNTYEVLTTKEICPYFNPAECLEGTITLSKNGCCKTCETVGCQVRKQSTVLKTSTCQSDQAVELTYCEGRCKTTSKYSSDANSMQHSCSCCQEKKTSKREVSLKCLDGSSSSYSYIYVEECGCTTTECEKDSQTSTQQEQQVETDQDQQQLVT
uniref:Uncharacterized protein n=1 Tax=Leptobrachium leishanense TaxID=445787 RepID=A0A8C5MHZ0_9ANUR